MMIKVEISGRENLSKHANYIFCHWHTFVPLALISAVPSIPRIFDRASHAWMQHPSWYMQAIHVVLRLIGVDKIILGSTGHSGREAADQLVEYLRRGYSTSKFFELKTWDRKKWPYPFSTVKMNITTPIQIASDNLDEAQKRITTALG
jgi:lysophospholipid acyltransferase (LPLAT)-like uncharacterized protein